MFIPNYLEITGGQALKDGAAIRISGAKNEVLGVMVAAVLTTEPVRLRNVPYISDVLNMGNLLRGIGVAVEYNPAVGEMLIRAKRITANILPDEAIKFRASYYLWGALLARFSITKEFDSLAIRIPGGCAFGGARAINFHIDVLANVFGARYREHDDRIEFVLPASRKNEFPIFSTVIISHGATFHWMLSVATSPDAKYIYNAAMEYEVPHLLKILNSMGANIRGSGTTAIMSRGSGLLLRGGDFTILPDRMESGFYALLALALRGRIKLTGVDFASIRPWYNSVYEIAGKARISWSENRQSVEFDFRGLRGFAGQNFICSPIPGKETDMHQIWAPVLATAIEESRVLDPIWSGRTGHIPELQKMGLDADFRKFEINNCVQRDSSDIRIRPSVLHPANVSGMDLRGTAGLFIAAAMADGTSRIDSPGYALRGFPNIVANLRGLGINVRESSGGAILQ